MWTKKLYTSTPFSTILLTKLRSSNSSPSILLSRCTSTILNQFSQFSSSREIEQKRIPLIETLFYRTPLFDEKYELFLRSKKSFCSESKSDDKKFHCWNCGATANHTTPFLVCHTCRSIQPVNQSIDYFQIFGLERKYGIEVEELEGKYKDWQKKLHPDLVHSKSQREREYAAEQSARVIDAYRTLTDPLSRAIYILKLQGVVVDEEGRIKDTELLAEIMELREAVEESEGTEALSQIQAQIQEKFQQWSNSFEDAFHSSKYDDALTSIQRMTYYKRANEEVVKKL